MKMNVKYKAISLKSGKVYETGESKAEVLRKLHDKYSTFKYEKRSELGKPLCIPTKIYPEPLMIVKEMEN